MADTVDLAKVRELVEKLTGYGNETVPLELSDETFDRWIRRTAHGLVARDYLKAQADEIKALKEENERLVAGAKALQRVHEGDCRALQREIESWQTERNEARACQESAESELTALKARILQVLDRAMAVCNQYHTNADDAAARQAYALALHDIAATLTKEPAKP